MSIAARKPVLPVIAFCCVLVGWLVWSAVPALAAAPETPEVSVESPAQATTATLRGVLNPQASGEAGSYEFLYKEGTTGCVGGAKAPEPAGMALGVEREEVFEELSSLKPDTEYTVCLRAENVSHEATIGPPVVFTTLPEAPVTESADAQGSTVVFLGGELSPGGGSGRLTYWFDYNTNGSCIAEFTPEEEAEGKQPPVQLSTPAVEIAEGKQLQVQAEVQGLEANETYTFCLVASNASGGLALGNGVSARTGRQVPVISGASIVSIGSSEALVRAEVYPHGELTTYRLEYGLSEAYGSSTSEVNISAQYGPAGIQAQLTGLTPDSEYHYRIVATSLDGAQGTPDATFTTTPTAVGSQGLPDNRAYEMVTPPNDGNSDVESPAALNVEPLSEGISTYSPFQSAEDGSTVTYPILSIFSGGYGGQGGASQVLAVRSPNGGWSQTLIQPAGYQSDQYQGFSNDLSVGIVQSGNPTGESEVLPPLTPEAPGEGYKILYTRTTNDGVYKSLITKAVPLNRNPETFGTKKPVYSLGRSATVPVFAGGSTDFSSLLFEANDALLVGEGALERKLEEGVRGEIAEGKNENYLYDDVGGRLSLVDVSPQGQVVPNATFGALPFEGPAYNPPDFSRAISGDGRRVFWTDLGSGIVYLRMDGSSTVQVSVGAARYWTASADGRYAFYTEGGGLYRFDAAPEAGDEQRETLADASAGVLGVVGASKDGEAVYFVAEGVLSAGGSDEGAVPVAGQPNLYVSTDGGTPVFIATLSNEDGEKIPPYELDSAESKWGDWQPGLGHRTARVTGNGGGLVFMSTRSLSVVGYPHGYPSEGAAEVYVYEAGDNRLYCASCGSSGEPPSITEGSGQQAAAFLPVNWGDTYLPQWISEDGDRVFFDAAVPLVAQDTNGKQDVYEWESEGSGSCAHGMGATGGCVFLLSGGTSESDSWFVGAGANGNDAFIVTRAQLMPEDGNGTFDLYDVRVNGVRPVSPPVCSGSGCQGVPAPPPTFATPSSVTFNGVGNFPSPSPPLVVKGKAKVLTRAQRLVRALKVCRHDRRRKRRVSCEVRARRHYGVVRSVGSVPVSARGRKHA